MTDRAAIDRLRGNAAGRHKRNAAIADAARAMAAKYASGSLVYGDIYDLLAAVQRADQPKAPRE